MTQRHQFSFLYLIAVLILVGIAGYATQGSYTGYQVSLLSQDQVAPPNTPLNNTIAFLQAFGFFTVVLPFLLIFTVVFGILEKTKLFGTEKVKGEDQPRKSLNSVVAFCIAFFVVAASNIVSVIQASLPHVALVLLVIIVFLLLFGSLMSEGEIDKGITIWKHKGLRRIFVVAIFIAVIAIFLGSFNVLDDVLFYVTSNLTGTFITSIILLIIIVVSVWFVVGGHKEKAGESS